VAEERVTRRGSLVKLGGAGIAAALGWKAVDEASGAGPAAVASGAVSCVLTPEQTEGPYFLPGDKVRRDVREGKPGTLLTLKLSVLDVSTCKPIKGAAVDIWHCDAVGNYAAVSNKTFMRGIQKTDAKGVATFKTVYPGWYQGRTVHIHMKVHVSNDVVHTGQLFFDDSLSDQVFQNSPYNSKGTRDMRNEDDSIFSDAGGSSAIVPVTGSGGNYSGSITVGVKTSSTQA
jgi:protocatechuate 3,4-dioxygenase beta subunit